MISYNEELNIDDLTKAPVMIVDDRPANLNLLTDILVSEGYNVSAFPSGKRALNAIKNNIPQLIILDINMPDMDGFEVCKIIKQNEDLKNIPVIFISALTDVQEKLKAFASGGVDYITKPFDVEEVKARINTHLRLVEADKLEKEVSDRRLIENQYFEQLENLNDAVVHINIGGKILYINQAACTLFGYEKKELMGKTIETLMPENYWAKHVMYRERYFLSPKTRTMGVGVDFVGRKKNGDSFPIDISLSSLYTRDGIIVSAEIKDLTRQQRIEMDLDEQQSLFEAVFQNIPDALFITDNDKNIVMATPSVSSIFASDNDLLVGTTALSLCAGEDDYKQLCQIVFDAFTDNTLKSHVINFMRADKTTFSGEVVGSVIKRRENKIIGYIFLVRDVTEREKYNEEKGKLQAQLQQAQKMEALGQLTGGIAHDFNNMLASIMGYTELIKDKTAPDDESVQRYLNEVLSASSRARDLISKMLVFSRGRGDASKVALNLESIVNETINILRPVLTTSIGIDLIVNDARPVIQADPVHLQQLIMNLCINARDAMTEVGQIDIKLDRISVEDKICHSCHSNFGGEYMRLSFRDDGEGINPDILGRLFDPFFTTKEVGKGTGMGLAMVHGITHEYGGHVIIDSKIGEGTVFDIYFPASAESLNSESTQDLIAADSKLGEGKRVVVVDDEPMITGYLTALLESYSFEVDVFNNSHDALDYLCSDAASVDIVITDQTMPEITGMVLSEKLLALKPEMKIILCSGYSAFANEKSTKSLGIKSFLLKPVKSDVLIGTIQEILSD